MVWATGIKTKSQFESRTGHLLLSCAIKIVMSINACSSLYFVYVKFLTFTVLEPHLLFVLVVVIIYMQIC